MAFTRPDICDLKVQNICFDAFDDLIKAIISKKQCETDIAMGSQYHWEYFLQQQKGEDIMVDFRSCKDLLMIDLALSQQNNRVNVVLLQFRDRLRYTLQSIIST